MIDIRRLAATDHAGVLAIYNHYVEHTHFTFDVEPITEDGREPWYDQFDGARRQCWVAVEGPDVMGYAASMALKAKKAYETSIEVSIYLQPDSGRRGLGSKLYGALFDALTDQDVHRAYAGIAVPNDASIAFHEKFGFRKVSHMSEVGRKFGRYWDVAWWEKGF